jgi:hypothetical protein
MEQSYWLGRKRVAAANARSAESSRARLVHLDLAGRYSVLAARAATGRAGTEEAREGLRPGLTVPEIPGTGRGR